MTRTDWVILSVLMVLAISIRIPFVLHPIYYNSDTAVIDLMAKHALKGEFSFYYWGEGYYGMLDHFLLIPLVKLFGTNPSVSQTLPLTLTLVFLALFHQVVKNSTNAWAAHWATLLFAIPSPFFIQWTFNAYQYIVVPILGMAHFLGYEHLRQRPSAKNHFLMGLLAGFSWYYYWLISVFWAAIFLSWWLPSRAKRDLQAVRDWYEARGVSKLWGSLWNPPFVSPWLRRIILLANTVLVVNTSLAVALWLHGDWVRLVHGTRVSLPFWPTAKISIDIIIAEWLLLHWSDVVTNARRSWDQAVVRNLGFGFVIGFSPALIGSLFGHSPSSPGRMVTLPELLSNIRSLLIDIVPAMMIPDGPRILNLVALLLFLGGVVTLVVSAYHDIHASLQGRTKKISLMPLLLFSGFTMTMLGSILGHRENSRYFFPMYLAIPVGIAMMAHKGPRVARVLTMSAILLTAADFWMADQSRAARPYIQQTYENLRLGLTEAHVTGGFADYWIAYWMTSASNEQLLFAPIGNNDRYKPYIKQIQAMPYIALIEEFPGISDAMTVKGASYHVVERKTIAGFPVAMLERI